MTASTGWIKLHRQALQNGWLQNHRLWVFWCYCLLKATHQPIAVTVGYQRISLDAGQLLFGREKAATELSMTVKQVRTCLEALKRANNLTVKTASKFSIITIVNWDSYQSINDEKGQQNGQQKGQEGASKGPARGHIQEHREIKKKPSPAKNPPADSRLFTDWFCFAFEICQGYRYEFESGKDGKALSEMLKTWPWKELVSKACHFLSDEDRFPKNKAPTLSFLKSKINDYPNHINGQADHFRELGLLPPDGTLLENWKPWATNPPTV